MENELIQHLRKGWDIPPHFTFESGRKNTFGEDVILFWHGVAVKMADIGFIVWFLCNNESRIWPPPRFDGDGRFVDFILGSMSAKKFDGTLLKKFSL